MNIHDTDFMDFCKAAAPTAVAEKVIGGRVRGLDKLALRTIQGNDSLPPVVLNLMVAYFFSAFANQVYHRNDLQKLSAYWAANKISTPYQAKKIMQENIYQVFEQLEASPYKSLAHKPKREEKLSGKSVSGT